MDCKYSAMCTLLTLGNSHFRSISIPLDVVVALFIMLLVLPTPINSTVPVRT
jgi:hypothetical protein